MTEEGKITNRILEFGKKHATAINNKLLDKVVANKGNCLCKSTPVSCPCGASEYDIEDEGHCHCKLFSIK